MTKCALCFGPGPLRRSHILPELMYGQLYEPNAHRFYQVDVEAGATEIFQKGLRERLLCAECESPRLSELERVYSQEVVLPDHVRGEAVELSVSYHHVKLCLLSVLWRAGISTLEPFASVELNESHQERLREMILSSDPGKDQDYGVIGHVVVSPGSPTKVARRFVGFPVAIDHEHWGCPLYNFVAGGVMWSIAVTAPSDRRGDVSLHASGSLVLTKIQAPPDMPLAAAARL